MTKRRGWIVHLVDYMTLGRLAKIMLPDSARCMLGGVQPQSKSLLSFGQSRMADDSKPLRRSWNWAVWVGFAIALFAALSYIPIFTRFPITRDIPWVNLLLFLASGCVLGIGVYRAFTQPAKYRGKMSGAILSILSLLLFGLFCFGVFYEARKIPAADNAPRVGQRAPDFTLTGADGKLTTLSQLLQSNRAVLLVFYRGYW